MGEKPGSVTPPDDVGDVYDRITDVVFALDEYWRFTFLNERASEVFDQSLAALYETEIWEAFPEVVGSTFQREFKCAMETQQPVTFEEHLETLDAWVEVRAYPSETGLTVHFHDTTDRVHREDQLRAREQALQDAYEVLAEPDQPLGDQVDALLGVVRETLGVECAALSSIDREENEYTFEAVVGNADAPETGTTVPLETTYCEQVVETGRTLALSDTEADAPALAARSADGVLEIGCYLGTRVIVDDELYGTFCISDEAPRSAPFSNWEVTFVELLSNWVGYKIERRRYRTALETSNEQLEQFASAASHDLQEPLRMVSSYLSLIDRRHSDELEKEAEEFLEFALDGAERMREMIDGLLAYSRVERQGDPFEPVDLNTVVDDVADDLQLRLEENDADLTVDPLPQVEGDDDQLRQVFQNLLSNAITYSGVRPPEIHVSTKQNDAGSVSDGARPSAISCESGTCVISVRDQGIGIDPEDRERIFDVFERLHSNEEYAGTGIGLALCQRIIERHGGSIWIDPDVEDGTQILFTLPESPTGDA
jgi:signal transduction histidine kinase